MKSLEDKILADSTVDPDGLIRVDSFLNHQIDVNLLDEIGESIYGHFKDKRVDKILTVESSGIAIALSVSKYFGNRPVVFAKKTEGAYISPNSFISEIMSNTLRRNYIIKVAEEYINEGDNLLIVDDFLSEGHSIMGLISIAEQGNANVVGIGVAIEKYFHKGGQALREMNYDLYSAATVTRIENGKIIFKEDIVSD